MEAENETETRRINWFEHTSKSLASRHPEARAYSRYLVERLSSLLLERLPLETSQELIELLPQHSVQDHLHKLAASAQSVENTSIGYSTFVEKTVHVLGCADLGELRPKLVSDEDLFRFSEKLATTFLWAVAQEFPSDIKNRMIDRLPSDLRARMDIYVSQADESKVA